MWYNFKYLSLDFYLRFIPTQYGFQWFGYNLIVVVITEKNILKNHEIGQSIECLGIVYSVSIQSLSVLYFAYNIFNSMQQNGI